MDDKRKIIIIEKINMLLFYSNLVVGVYNIDTELALAELALSCWGSELEKFSFLMNTLLNILNVKIKR